MAKNVNTKQIDIDKAELRKRLKQLQEKQIEYWRDRAERNFLAGEKDALQVAKGLQDNYESCVREIEKEINAFYGKYAKDNKISLEEAKVLLNKDEKKSFKAYIADMLKMGKKENFTDNQLHEFKKLYTKAKITRLEELQANIKFQIDRLTNINKVTIQNLLSSTYEKQYYTIISDVEEFNGFSSSFSGLDNRLIENAINTKWLGTNYAIALYKNEQNLLTILNQEVPRGLTLGYNPRKLARQVSAKLGTNYNNTVRLIRTEYSKLQNDATLLGYKEAGITDYKLLVTLDNRTSEICHTLDKLDEIYKVNEAETGVNYPPFHPNCRTTTVPYFEPDEFDEMTPEELQEYVDNLDTLGWLKDMVEQKENK